MDLIQYKKFRLIQLLHCIPGKINIFLRSNGKSANNVATFEMKSSLSDLQRIFNTNIALDIHFKIQFIDILVQMKNDFSFGSTQATFDAHKLNNYAEIIAKLDDVLKSVDLLQ